ncbi:DNA polymerase IV [Clostridium sp.]|jgi:DNA polymerase IV|uniref:DNA polymerase IV n=1 Tax=Clostridium sp. TaxID=1506 RepID=UPI0039F4DAB6
MERVIMHVDMDAFFASIEIVDNPKLKGKPVIVGGTSERGVVATCSYEARKYGVRSAMPIYMAKSKCPHGIFLPTRMWRYKEVSREIFKIFYTLTPYVEPLSIDEAYLDITHSKIQPLQAAKYIKEEVNRNTHLTLSVGISFNKFLAKIASDWNKPNGLKIITKDMIPEVLFPLSIDKVYGLGKKSVKKLNDIGVFTIEELYNLPIDILIQFFGKYGIEIYERIRGIDKRKVEISRQRKSIGRENTLKRDTDDKNELKEYIKSFCFSISKDLSSKNVSGKTITLKIKTSSFENHTKTRTLSSYISKEEDIYKEACEILDSIELNEKIRLIGVSVSSLKENKIKQMTLFDC